MTIQAGATINVTPLIDVLLVLLIIFMVIVPAHSVGLAARAPAEGLVVGAAPEAALVVTVLEDGGAVLNREKLGAGEWVGRLRTVLSGRADRTVFFARRRIWSSGWWHGRLIWRAGWERGRWGFCGGLSRNCPGEKIKLVPGTNFGSC